MLTRLGAGRYRHANGDSYRIVVTAFGTGQHVVAVLGGNALQLPTVSPEDYTGQGSPYFVSLVFTFTNNGGARYETKILFEEEEVDMLVSTPPAGVQFPFDVNQVLSFEVV